MAALDPTTALALVARIRILDEALSDVISHVPAGEKRDQLVRVLSDMDSTGDVFACVDKLAEERDAFRAMVVDLLMSAHPHPVEHPTMTAAWARARALLQKYPRHDSVTDDAARRDVVLTKTEEG